MGVGTVYFGSIKVSSPLAGSYNITFGGEGIIGDMSAFTAGAYTRPLLSST